VGEQDYYAPKDVDGKYKEYGTLIEGFGDTVGVTNTLTPTHVVFNRPVGALTGDKALTAAVGAKVLFIHSGLAATLGWRAR